MGHIARLFLICLALHVLQMCQGKNTYFKPHVQRGHKSADGKTIVKSDIAVSPGGDFNKGRAAQIVGGFKVMVTEYPWHVLLVMNGSTTCGGSLISTRTVLTAGHCLYNSGKVEVYIGGVNRLALEPNEQYFKTYKYIVHEYYRPSTLANDVALAFLERDVQITQFVDMIRLPMINDAANHNYYISKPITVCGYGKIETGGAYSNVLKCVKLYVWDNEQCAEYFNPGLIRNSTLCTKPSEEAICKGDSGGPAIIYESDGKPTLVSIASFVAAMGCSDYPNGFVRVESFLSWILLHIEGQYDDRNY